MAGFDSQWLKYQMEEASGGVATAGASETAPRSEDSDGEMVVEILVLSERMWPGRATMSLFGHTIASMQTSMGAGTSGQVSVLKLTGNIRKLLNHPRPHVAVKRATGVGGGAEAYSEYLTSVLRELRVLSTAQRWDHPGLVRLLAVYFETDSDPALDDRPWPALVLEHAEMGNVIDYLSANSRTSSYAAWDICRQVGDALAFLHAHYIIHGDMKPQHVLIMRSGRWSSGIVAKLSDLGGAVIGAGMDDAKILPTGSPVWAAPEHLDMLEENRERKPQARRIRQLQATDVYSFGLFAAVVMLRRPASWLLQLARKLEPSRFLEKMRRNLEPEAADLLIRLKRSDPPRITAGLKQLLSEDVKDGAIRDEVFHLLDLTTQLDPSSRDLAGALHRTPAPPLGTASETPRLEIDALSQICPRYPLCVQRAVVQNLVARASAYPGDGAAPLRRVFDLLACGIGGFEKPQSIALMKKTMETYMRTGSHATECSSYVHGVSEATGITTQEIKDTEAASLELSVRSYGDWVALVHLRHRHPEQYESALKHLRLVFRPIITGMEFWDGSRSLGLLLSFLRAEVGEGESDTPDSLSEPDSLLPNLHLAVLQNCPQMVRRLVEQGADPFHTPTGWGYAYGSSASDRPASPFFLAVLLNLPRVLRAMVPRIGRGNGLDEFRRNLQESEQRRRLREDNYQLLLYAAMCPALRLERARIHGGDHKTHMADTTQVLVWLGESPSCVLGGLDIFSVAARLNHPGVIRIMHQEREKFAKDHLAHRGWQSDMVRSVLAGNVTVFRALKDCAPSAATAARYQGQSLLHLSSQAGHRNLALPREICTDTSLIHIRDDLGRTPVICAILSGFFKMADYLIDNGAEMQYDHGGETMLARMLQNTHIPLDRLVYFLKKMPRLEASRATECVWPALGRNPFHAIASVTSDACDADLRARYWALRDSLPFCVASIRTSLINQEDWLGNTPLMLAVWHGHEAMVDMLLQDSADVHHRGHVTALTAAKLSRRSLLTLKGGGSDWERHKLAGDLEKMDSIITKLRAAGAQDSPFGFYVNIFRVLTANHFAVRQERIPSPDRLSMMD
ncbi:hypothetical protein B0T25DRAFT_567351 [Lasiosphaeria hispida]|uniref:Protein kinase domain-containing protein n=1 Tax=Lasiosphaeria hispida TaxID=260671 RepID=A0AAJ0HNG0_9PEZI|nr:hypothetical protein B0T25DRAFT_567351 [Lasiosphaeria hispida]